MLKNLHCHFNNSFQFLWYCRHWAFKVIDILCVVERQKIERKWSQHKYFVGHGEQIYSCPVRIPQLQKLPYNATVLSSYISISTCFVSSQFCSTISFKGVFFP